MTQLLDDQLLGSVLRGESAPRPGEPIFTTGYWYVRLCQAVLSASDREGVLSSLFNKLPGTARDRALRALLELPDEVGLVSLRTLGPLIGQLRNRHQLNILSIEALAAAVHLEADVFLSAPSLRLEDALREENRHVEVVR